MSDFVSELFVAANTIAKVSTLERRRLLGELFVAANTIAKVSTLERRRLLERATMTIGDMLERVGKDSAYALRESLQSLHGLKDEIEALPDAIASHALCEAADLLRGLATTSAWTAGSQPQN